MLPYRLRASCTMRLFFLLSLSLVLQLAAEAQFNLLAGPVPPPTTEQEYGANSFSFPRKKLLQRNHGVIVGIQRGRSTAIELGGEAHWRKISLKKPQIIGATANMEYDFSQHMVGYKVGGWMKQGRVNFTYGGNLGYHTDFKGRNIFSAGPAVGFRFAGLHLINGYNFLMGDTEFDKEGTGVNKLFMSLRYYFPLENKFTWDKQTRRKKEKDREKKQREKEKRRNNNEKDGGRKILGIEF